jgi:LPXTG-motif cell wall-anchored protein
VRKIGLALALMAMAGIASATNTGSNSGCYWILWWEFCPAAPSIPNGNVKAPEIDPASAMAGLTLLAGGLVVLRGRREKNRKD